MVRPPTVERPTPRQSGQPRGVIADVWQLLEWNVLERGALKETKWPETRFMSVPKGDDSRRAIFDCRRINERAGPPPALRLIGKEEIFLLTSFFSEPWFAEADFRHWFFQLALSQVVRNAFTFRHGRERLRCWPMGFSWSPVVAQAVTMTLLLPLRRAPGVVAAK
jgi:hypothetical protein